MRNVSQTALEFLTRKQGLEPVNVVDISWVGGSIISYADRNFPGLQGKILEIANLENVVNLKKSSSSVSVSIKLDDTDGSIKNVYNNNDIHKRPVWIYQWFVGMPLEDRFLLFDGVIESPIVWNEGDRTLSFEVTSKLEDLEIGFSPEEGDFPGLPHKLIGKPWPLPFGTTLFSQSVQVDPIPRGVTQQGTGIADQTILTQLSNLTKQLVDLRALMLYFFHNAVAYYGQSQRFENPPGDQAWVSLGDQATDKGNECIVKMGEIQKDMTELLATLNKQKEQEKESLSVFYGETFPQGEQIGAYLNGALHTGIMVGNQFNIETRSLPDGTPASSLNVIPEPLSSRGSVVLGEGQIVPQKGTFFWVPPSLGFMISTFLPVRYIVAMLPVEIMWIDQSGNLVGGVFAYKLYNGQKILTPVPTNYYAITYEFFGPIHATIVTMGTPLSALTDQGWEDDIYVVMRSPVGPNAVDIMTWIIQNYTILYIDAGSFNYVRGRVDPFPMNFVLFDRKNVITVLEEIAYQARCAIWIKDGVFYLKYIPDALSPVEYIDESTVEYNSLIIEHTSTESVITKYVASFKVQYDQTGPFDLILRNNVIKYGIHEKKYDYYCYNNPDLVDIVATFWLIRESNTWKLIKFKTFLDKMRVETYDNILINFSNNFVANEPVTGVVESVQLNSKDLSVEMSVWLPVRLGEMTAYPFGYLVDSEILIYPLPQDHAGGGGIGAKAKGDLTPKNKAKERAPTYTFIRNKIDQGRGNPGTRNPNIPISIDTAIGPGAPFGPPPLPAYNYRAYGINPILDISQVSKTVPAKVFDITKAPTYIVQLYNSGINNVPTKSFAIDVQNKIKLKVGDFCMVSTVVWSEKDPRDPTKTITKAANYMIPSVPAAGGAMPGQIIGVINYQTYMIDLYRNGTSSVAEQVLATELQLDPTDFINIGTWVLVAQVEGKDNKGNSTGSEYYIKIPIFLE